MNWWKDIKEFNGINSTVTKYVFTKENAVAETVLYRYKDSRIVICCSTQSGCPVGCKFCGTGNKFVRNLTSEEIVEQVSSIVSKLDIIPNSRCEKFQIMFMSMGEPFLNLYNVNDAIRELNKLYPNAQLLVSTMGTIPPVTSASDFLRCSKEIDKVGLQLSIHEMDEDKRNELIPFKNKMSIRELRNFGITWNIITDRPVFLNFCISERWSDKSIDRLLDMFPPIVFNLTFSVICNTELGGLSSKGFEIAKEYEAYFRDNHGYNTRTFNPDGQDDIGAGCGQLWYVQDWIKNKEN